MLTLRMNSASLWNHMYVVAYDQVSLWKSKGMLTPPMHLIPPLIYPGVCVCHALLFVLFHYYYFFWITNWLQFVIFAFQFTRVVLENHKQFIYFLLNLHYSILIWYTLKWSFFECCYLILKHFVCKEHFYHTKSNVVSNWQRQHVLLVFV